MEKILICQSTMPDIDFDYKKLDKEEIELFVTLSLVTREKEISEELKNKFEEFAKVDPLTNLIYLRYKYFKDKLVSEFKPIDVYNWFNTFQDSSTLNTCFTIVKSAFEKEANHSGTV